MKRFKLKQGNSEPYDITKENFEKLTLQNPPYTKKGKGGENRCFGICPGCDNPIQLIGLYKKIKNTERPYGKHYNRDASIAAHNEQAYKFCPYASNRYNSSEKILKEDLTDFEKGIYYTLRDNFDYAIFLLEDITGLKINTEFAGQILSDYLASSGYMYYGATYYNIPWMLLYFTIAKPCYHKLIKKDGPAYNMLMSQKKVKLVQYKSSSYYIVEKADDYAWLDLQFSAILHNRNIVNDEVQEEILFVVSSVDKSGLPVKLAEKSLKINEYRFPKLIHSEKAKAHRNDELLQMAKKYMPDI